MTIGRDAGMVTAEAAVVLPVLVLVAAVGVGLLQAAATMVRAGDAAHVVALAAARGDPSASDLAMQVLPGAHVSVVRSGDRVDVRVTAATRIGPFAGPDVSGRAVAPDESALGSVTTAAVALVDRSTSTPSSTVRG